MEFTVSTLEARTVTGRIIYRKARQAINQNYLKSYSNKYTPEPDPTVQWADTLYEVLRCCASARRISFAYSSGHV